MNNYKDQEYRREEFANLCKIFLVRMKMSKSELAEKLGIDPTYFSKLYKGKRPVTAELLETLKQIVEDQKSTSPDKAAVQENLPKNPNSAQRQIDHLQSIIDTLRADVKSLIGDVAVLVKDLERTKIDSEKKIRGQEERINELEARIENDTVRVTVEPSRNRLPRGERAAAANDE